MTIDPAVAGGLERIALRERDVSHAYESGFTPEASDVASAPASVRSFDPLSVVAPEGTFFLTPGTDGTVEYSRDGTLHVQGGRLCASDGRPVLGFALGNRTTLGTLRFDPYDAALGRVSGARIAADGTFGYARTSIDPRSGERRVERVVVGRIALARFPAGSQPVRADGVVVRAPAGVTANVGVPADGNFRGLITNARDLGRLDILGGLSKMQEAYAAFEALRSANHARGALDKTAMDLLK